MARASSAVLAVLLFVLSVIVSSGAFPPPPRVALAARQQEPKDFEDFEKREVENCVPYDIRSSIVGSRAVVEWATRRTYIRKVKLQKAKDRSPALSTHGALATTLLLRWKEEPFSKKEAATYTTDGATLTSHTAFINLQEGTQNVAYEFVVGSMFHGWSAVHRLGINLQLVEGYHAHIELEGPNATPVVAWANSTLFEDDGKKRSKRWLHVVRLEGLKPYTRYTYVVGNAYYKAWSIPYVTKTAPAPLLTGEKPKPTRFLVTGDIGYQNAATLPMMQSEVAEGVVEGVVSVGDYAYDLDMINGHVGDIFMQEIEPIASSVPFMVCPGNHETHNVFSHYSQRFRLMPSNENKGVQIVHTGGPSKEAYPNEVPNNWFYSFDVGLVHFTIISTEIYFKKTLDVDGDVIARQEAWLEQDLAKANANREQIPWLVVIGHRPMYCTSDDTNCGKKAAMLRDKLEDKFYMYGVDLYLCGHQHNYERAFDVYKSQTWKRTRNMRATTHILTGASGQYLTSIMRKSFERPAEVWDAFRNSIFGYSRMEVINATHLHWQQVEADPENPAARGLYGQVVDDVWFVQEKHGSFAPVQAAP
ncbi:unnamed protein product [Peronospora destructor]|uniref:Purple acid phosphatase n=1 Tax=Peronospora destructor TaxID=86335 RepID=A0AAV0UL29_9STRA|nr:unnamed protein product [Peronospora destructor]